MLNLETAVRDGKVMQDFDSESKGCVNLPSPTAVSRLNTHYHIAKGLLFGFGLRNSLFGDLRFRYSNTKFSSELKKHIVKHLKKPSLAISTNQVKCGEGSPSNFTIPLFCAIDGDDTAKKYIEEKNKIEKIYQGKDLVEVTLQALASL